MTRLRWLLLLAPVGFSACAWWMAGRRDAIGGDQLIFSHAFHDDYGFGDCVDCHAGVEKTTDTAVSFLPVEATCMECHDDNQDNCSYCHTDVEQRLPRSPKPQTIAFSHAAHVPLVEGDCARCHPSVLTATHVPSGRPSMDGCLSCHNHATEFAEANCLRCHPTLGQVPLTAVAQLDHSGDWMARHSDLARSHGEACLQCHSQSSCSECHSRNPAASGARLFPESVGRTLLHRGDFAATHAIDARASGDLCLRCHQSNTCVRCHSAVGLTPEGSNPRNPHPAGYALPGGARFHGTDARLHIETCAACHDRGGASNCVDCHSTGGIGGNPHPPGWALRYSRAQINREAMCRTCHRGGL